MVDIFISYRRDDCQIEAKRLYKELEGRFGAERIFLDIVNIPGAESNVFSVEIDDAIRASKVFLALIGPGWLYAEKDGKRRLWDPEDYVRKEIETAYKRKDANRLIEVQPILVNDATIPDQQVLQSTGSIHLPRVTTADMLRFRDDSNYQDDVEAICQRIEVILRRLEAATPPPFPRQQQQPALHQPRIGCVELFIGLLVTIIVVLFALAAFGTFILPLFATPTPTNTPTITPTETATIVVSDTPLLTTLRSGISLRTSAGSQFIAIRSLNVGELLDILGVTEDGNWYLVSSQNDEIGWIVASPQQVAVSGDLSSVQVVEPPTITPSPDAPGTQTREALLTSAAASATQAQVASQTADAATQAQISNQLTAAAVESEVAASATDTVTPSPSPTYTHTPSITPSPTPTVTPSFTPSPSETPTELETRMVYVPDADLWIDREVVNQSQFAEFVAAAYDRQDYWSDKGWDWHASATTPAPTLGSSLPYLPQSVYEAEAYCAWKGWRLPLSDEWTQAYEAGVDGFITDPAIQEWTGSFSVVNNTQRLYISVQPAQEAAPISASPMFADLAFRCASDP